MKICFYLFAFLLSTMTRAQTSIRLPEYFDGEGILFPDSVRIPFTISNLDSTFNATLVDVIAVEKKLASGILKKRMKSRSKVREVRKYWNRQYVGYTIKGSNKRHMLVVLLNFKDRERAEYQFSEWKKVIYIGNGDFYYANLRIFEIPLD